MSSYRAGGALIPKDEILQLEQDLRPAAIVAHYPLYAFVTDYPTGMIRAAEAKVARSVERRIAQGAGWGRGRPPNPRGIPSVRFTAADMADMGQAQVYFHNLDEVIRIFDGEWRESTGAEQEVYESLAMFMLMNNGCLEIPKGVYGSIRKDIFRVVPPHTGGDRPRFRSRGKVCTSYSLIEIIMFLQSEGAVPDYQCAEVSTEIAKQYIIYKNAPRHILPDDPVKIMGIYRWYMSINGARGVKRGLAEQLELVLRQNNKLIEYHGSAIRVSNLDTGDKLIKAARH